MGQKVNPHVIRLGTVHTWSSRWFDERQYKETALEDFHLRKQLMTRLRPAGISKVQVGDYVNRTNIGGIVTISTLENVRVRFPITETEYLRFAKRSRTDTVNKKFADLPVQLILSDGTLYPETGKIDLANRQVDPETGSLLVQALFNNRTGILRPGQYVKVRFQTDIYENAVLVPQQAVNQLQSIYQVFILNDSNKLSPRVVTAGARIGGNWVITEGLKTGEKVAVIGSASINIKNPVRPVMMNWNYDSTSRN